MKYAKIFIALAASVLGAIVVYEVYQFAVMFIGNVMYNYYFVKNLVEYFS